MSEKRTIVHPRLFTLGTMGPKGERVFFFQCVAEDASEVFSIKCEKEHVLAITDVLEFVLEIMPPDRKIPLEELETREPESTYIPWTIGDLSILCSQDNDQIELMITELILDEEEEYAMEERIHQSDISEPDPNKNSITFILSKEQADGLVRVAKKLISEGRPLCTFCQAPLNNAPDSEFCACWN